MEGARHGFALVHVLHLDEADAGEVPKADMDGQGRIMVSGLNVGGGRQ